jgi:hypothetical protein
MQEITKISNQTLELRKLEKLGEKSSYLDLISKMRWESFQILRDLAENQCRSVWVEGKYEKIEMNRVWGCLAVFIKRWVNGICLLTGAYEHLTIKWYIYIYIYIYILKAIW